MFDESTDTSSSVNFLSLRKECFMLVRQDYSIKSNFPNIGVLANEFERQELSHATLDDLAVLFRSQPINFIKEARTRFPGMSLVDAKRLQEGHWYNKGWLAGQANSKY